MAVLLTGGAGYIGSHTALALLRAGHEVVVVDNLDNGRAEALRRVGELAGRTIPLHRLDLRDTDGLRAVLAAHPVEAVVHLAGLKSVGESVADPVRYYATNLGATTSLLTALADTAVRRVVFSSSAMVYGDADRPEYVESMPVRPTTPYGWTKAVIEQMLIDLAGAGLGFAVSILRYFNPVGADPSGRIGEDPRGTPNNLLPVVARVAVGRLAALSVFGGDYDTVDGTGVRDYIHVSDLADGHLAALAAPPPPDRAVTYNLGTGQGASVLQVLAEFARASGRTVPHRIVARRSGDVPACWADPTRAATELGWKARRSLAEACTDAWRWQSANPTGYDQAP